MALSPNEAIKVILAQHQDTRLHGIHAISGTHHSLRVQAQTSECLVHSVATVVDSEAGQREPVGGDRAHRRAVRDVIGGAEQLVDEDRHRQLPLRAPAPDQVELLGSGPEDQHGQAEHRQVAILSGADPLTCQDALDALIRYVGRHATRTGRGDRAGATSSMDPLRDLLHASFAEYLTANDLARAAGRSRFQVYRLFREQYGLSPSAYLRQLRLRAARRALAAGEPPGHVAAATGFADQAHLTRWFRRTYGITPATYQRAAIRPSGRHGTTE